MRELEEDGLESAQGEQGDRAEVRGAETALASVESDLEALPDGEGGVKMGELFWDSIHI